MGVGGWVPSTTTHPPPNQPNHPTHHPPSWAFLSWLLDDSKLKFYEQAAALALFVRGVSIAINIISATKFVKFIAKKRAKKNKKQNMWERLTKAP
jgi:hypothetical protein